ncbi:MAG: TonB-dependent receptor [Bacteroidales bacterium]|nr:TonB-dependent receptor [Bacteroidales bacterium]
MKKLLLSISFMLLIIPLQVMGQQKTVTGKITSSTDGSPLPGVNVVIKGTMTGTTTNIDGEYSITIDEGNTLVFTFVGYSTQEIIVGTQTVIDVTLEERLEALDEVVVIGYGETTRKSFTGSLSSVESQAIENIPQENAIKMMQGRAAGVYVTDADGQPGSSASILIRGLGTFVGSGSPLYVIDGIPASNFDSFNPSDIESITFLKDAAATSIYGSRASAGVVIITTKKGTPGKTKIDFIAQYGFSDIENPNDFKLMNREEYLEYYREAAINAGIDPEDPASGILYLPLSGQYYDTDWFDAVTRQGTTQNYELSLNGGSDKTTYFFSLGYFDQTGTVLGTSFDRFTGRLNLNHKISDKIDFELKVLGSVNNRYDRRGGGGGRSGNLSGAYRVSPLSSIYADENTPFIYNGLGFNFDLPSNAGHNPVAVAELTENYLQEYRALPSLRVNFSPIKNLKLWASAAYDFIYATRKEFMSKYYLGETEGGRSDQSWYQNISSNYNAVAEYLWNVNPDNNLKFLAGTEVYKYVGEVAEAGSTTFGFDAINNFAAGQATSVGKLGYSYNGNTLISVFTRIDYTYKDRLFAHGSFRRDGSSVFGPGNRWGNFYALGVGYSLTEAPFIESIDLVSTLKLKASYGIAGNPNSGDFAWRNTYSPGGAYNLPGSPNPGTVINTPGNPNLKWEQSAQANAGFDLGLLNDRIMMSLEYYDIRSIDLISNRPISVTSGYTSIIDNIAEIKNNGIEVVLTTTNISTPDFIWSTTLNITANSNEVVSLTTDADTLILNNRVAHIKGQPAYQWFMPTYAGVDPATGRPLYYTETGEVTYDYSNAEVKVQGTNPNVAPSFYGGFENTFTYKGIRLSGLFYFRYGGKIFRGLYQDLMMSGGGGGSNMCVDDLERWQKPGDITDVPRLDATYTDPGPSSRWLEDASYIRLRNLSLSYTFPKSLVSSIGLSDLTLSVNGVNIITFTKYGGLNVTTGAEEDDDVYPASRTITFGINAKF